MAASIIKSRNGILTRAARSTVETGPNTRGNAIVSLGQWASRALGGLQLAMGVINLLLTAGASADTGRNLLWEVIPVRILQLLRMIGSRWKRLVLLIPQISFSSLPSRQPPVSRIVSSRRSGASGSAHLDFEARQALNGLGESTYRHHCT
jgi:hypothetical protein